MSTLRFSDIIAQAKALLQREGRLTYRSLKREFALEDEALEDLKFELIEGQRVAADEDDKVLVWVETTGQQEPEKRGSRGTENQLDAQPSGPTLDARPRDSRPSAGERRQITVLFCDLVGSTALSTQLDPEDYHAVVQAYHQTCTTVIRRHEGYVAQPLGDGVLVYFGYPTAHEDDARRALRTGLEIIEAVRGLQGGAMLASPLQVRIGVHTGLVVVGEIGGGERRELLALGETPNLAARIQGLAEPDTLLMSAATQRLVEAQFESHPFGTQLLKGFPTPIAVYHVQSERQGVSPLAGKETLTPLVGREQEVSLLLDRWEQTKEGRGQAILLSGEPGIGKSRLALTLKEHVAQDESLLDEARCSPYHQHSALYPFIEMMRQTLLLARQDSDERKVARLEQVLALYGMQDTLPLFTALLSFPTPEHYPPLTVTPQKQKERTFQALLQLMTVQAERQATVSVWEDLHWADPSSLEFLSLLIDQIPTTKMLLVLTFRPEFTPPWKPRSHISQLVLNRLGKKQVEVMIKQAAGKRLPVEVIEQIRLKTDGVPLFVEEVTKTVMESVESVGALESSNRTPLQLVIPATLQEALLARLDRLSTARPIAQLGATLGREFSYELLQAVTPLNEIDLHVALTKLVEAEILYQRGVGEQARYFFKHALIQDTAYQSLLKSMRGQYHQQIAKVLDERFPDLKTNQPELLAHHYTEGGMIEQAIPYWQQAGQQAIERWAHEEAIRYLTKGIDLLRKLPEAPEHIQQELILQSLLGVPLMMTQGWAAPVVKQTFMRALELSEKSEDTPQLFSVLIGLANYYGNRAENRTAQALAERCQRLADRTQDPELRLIVSYLMGGLLAQTGEIVRAREHCKQGLDLYDLTQHHTLGFRLGVDPGAACGLYAALAAWYLGYPDQALAQAQDTQILAQNLAYPSSQVLGFVALIWIRLLRREPALSQEQLEPLMTLLAEKELAMVFPIVLMFKGVVLAEQGSPKDGLTSLQQGWTALQVMGTRIYSSTLLLMLAHTYQLMGRTEEGLTTIAEASVFIKETGERWYEAELYRLKGELTLEARGWRLGISPASPQVFSPQSQVSWEGSQEAEGYLLKAIDIAQKQQAKSWELRAATSLARLWQQQGKTTEARNLLAPVYNWFTEGFDTKDLQEAKALLEELH